jgi:class 3 adenylate cyclase
MIPNGPARGALMAGKQGRVERRQAAIFAADVAGHARLMAQDEVRTLRSVTASREIMDPLIDEYGGRIANTALRPAHAWQTDRNRPKSLPMGGQRSAPMADTDLPIRGRSNSVAPASRVNGSHVGLGFRCPMNIFVLTGAGVSVESSLGGIGNLKS